MSRTASNFTRRASMRLGFREIPYLAAGRFVSTSSFGPQSTRGAKAVAPSEILLRSCLQGSQAAVSGDVKQLAGTSRILLERLCQRGTLCNSYKRRRQCAFCLSGRRNVGQPFEPDGSVESCVSSGYTAKPPGCIGWLLNLW